MISTGENFCGALDSLGNLFTWGMNDFGQLGHGDRVVRCDPQKVS